MAFDLSRLGGWRELPFFSDTLPGIEARLGPLDRATIDALMQGRESYFDRFIGTVDQRWGSLDGYLGQAIGVDDALRDQLQARFVA